MSSTLSWQPVDQEWKNLSSDTKFILREEYGENVNCVLTDRDVKFLRGLLLAGSDNVKKDAETLIGAISQHKKIALKEIF